MTSDSIKRVLWLGSFLNTECILNFTARIILWAWDEMPNIEPEEKTQCLSNQKIITISDPEFNNNCSTFKEESVSKRWLRRVKRIPGLGLILVILKNLLSVIADSVVKKIENIGIIQEMLD